MAITAKRHLNLSYPHVGLRKIKSVLTIFVGFCLWQILRLFLPELEVHPIFIYLYGFLEIRESSEKTKDYGRLRIIATFVAISVGFPFMFLMDFLRLLIQTEWMQLGLEITLLLIGSLVVLCVAELTRCGTYCGLAAAIYIILMVSHTDNSMYLYSVMRAVQTILGVGVAWFINVILLPYPPKPGSLSYFLIKKKAVRKGK